MDSPEPMKMCVSLCAWVILCLTAIAASAQSSATIFAAASLRGGLEAALSDWDGAARVSYGGSGAVARQVALGAPADLVILANSAWGDWLQENGPDVLASDARLIANTLVLIGAPEAAPFDTEPNPDTVQGRLGAGRLAMGQRDAVPAGHYAEAWLHHIGAWDDLRPRLAETENVRAALAFVARGETPLGLVYGSDVMAEPRVKILWHIDPATHPAIAYPALAYTQAGVEALAHLRSTQAQAAFQAHGFVTEFDGEPMQ